MRLGEAMKAVGLAALILALNFLVTTAVIFAYAIAVEPGRSDAFYQAAAPRIAAWSAPIGGALLFLAALAVLGRRRPGRHPMSFAVRAWIAYVILDVASGLAAGVLLPATLSWMLAASMGLALAGALAGAALARSPSAAILA